MAVTPSLPRPMMFPWIVEVDVPLKLLRGEDPGVRVSGDEIAVGGIRAADRDRDAPALREGDVDPDLVR